MNKGMLWLALATMILTGFAGCAKKDNGNDGGNNTNVSSLDENATYDSAIADTGWRVTGTLDAQGAALTAGANGSAASVKVADLTPDDSAGALDKADFLLDAKEADGSRVQAELRSMTTAHDEKLGGDFFGGVAHNVMINGDSGVGYAELPKVKAYLLMTGLARVKHDEQTLEQLQLVQVAVTKGFHHDEDGDFLATPEENDLELHVIFPGKLLDANHTLPGFDDGFLYYYFENVKLTQLTMDEKATVGSKLKPAEKPNQPPVANGVVSYNGTQVSKTDWDPESKWLNVTLDASNSTDPDGRIEAYSWDVKEVNATGVLVPVNRTSGQVANFSFTSPGQKQIELRVIDEDGGIANASIIFFINYKKIFTYSFPAQGAGQTAGAGTSCQPALNCFEHTVSVVYGAKQMTVAAPKQTSSTTSTVCNSPKVNVLDPNGKSLASGATSATIKEADLKVVGKYKVQVYFQAQVQCAYSDEVHVFYDSVPA